MCWVLYIWKYFQTPRWPSDLSIVHDKKIQESSNPSPRLQELCRDSYPTIGHPNFDLRSLNCYLSQFTIAAIVLNHQPPAATIQPVWSDSMLYQHSLQYFNHNSCSAGQKDRRITIFTIVLFFSLRKQYLHNKHQINGSEAKIPVSLQDLINRSFWFAQRPSQFIETVLLYQCIYRRYESRFVHFTCTSVQ